MAAGQAVDHVGQMRFGIEAARRSALQHRLEGCGPLAAEEQEADGDGAQRPLGDIVVDRQPTVAGVAISASQPSDRGAAPSAPARAGRGRLCAYR